jgi:nicotinamide riboside transporter PnuC
MELIEVIIQIIIDIVTTKKNWIYIIAGVLGLFIFLGLFL